MDAWFWYPDIIELSALDMNFQPKEKTLHLMQIVIYFFKVEVVYFDNSTVSLSTCSSVDRAVVSGTMCGGSIPFRRAAWDVCTVPVRCITGVIRIGNCQKSYGGSERSKR